MEKSLKDKIKLLIFDLDGTLVDSLIDITNALNHAITSLGYEPLTPERTRALVGRGITKLIESILREEDRPKLPEVLDRFLSFYSAHLTEHTRVYPGVIETLKALNRYKKAVLSNKREALSKRVINELGLLGYFDYVIGSDTLSAKKPSPEGILYLLEKEGLRPSEVIMVGDSEIDIQTARRAGVLSVAVGYGYRDPAFLKDADYFLMGPLTELITLLDMPSWGSS